jgi:hypothetical protein
MGEKIIAKAHLRMRQSTCSNARKSRMLKRQIMPRLRFGIVPSNLNHEDSMELEVSSQATESRKRGGQFKRESICETPECLEPDQHSARDNVNEDHTKKRRMSGGIWKIRQYCRWCRIGT